MLLQTAVASGLAGGLSRGLAPWRVDRAVHDPARRCSIWRSRSPLGGDCLADLALVRAQPELFGPVASDPTVSRLIETLAADPDPDTTEAAIAAIRVARAEARTRVWSRVDP